jgi:oxygen-independent coproporphyrinogen-3 oxidase
MATVRHRKPENWLEAVARQGRGIAEERMLSTYEQASEALLMGLRLTEGIDLAELSARCGIAPGHMVDRVRLDFYADRALCWRDGSRIGVTEAGMPLLDALLGELVPAELVAP